MKNIMRNCICSMVAMAAVAIGAMMLAPAEVQAKELVLKDYGNGFYLPEDFNLRDSDGKILTAPKLDTSVWGAGTYEEEKEMQLDNGMKAVKWWKKTDDGKAFPCVSVYDESGMELYRAGRDNCNELVVYMGNEDGDTMLSHYTKTTVRYEDGTTVAYVDDYEQPRTMEQYYADEKRSRSESYSYDSDYPDDVMITANETYWDGEGFREKGETFINGQLVSSYSDVDVITFDDWEFTVQEPVALTKELVKRLEPCFQEGDTHICPSYTSLLEGQPLIAFNTVTTDENGDQVSTIRYYLKEHLEIMEENGYIIRPHLENGQDGTPYIMYDVIKKECPLYLYDELLASETPALLVTSAKAEEMFKKQDEFLQGKKDAIIKGEDRQEEIETAGTAGAPPTYSEVDGCPTWTQKIVGDIVPINGGTPVYCMTRLWEGHRLVSILDADMQQLAGQDYAFDDNYTDYEYVYFTMLDILDTGTCVFQLAGTNDAGMSGNFNRTSAGTTETDKGMTGNTTYYQDWGGSVGIDPNTGQPFEYGSGDGGYDGE